MDVREIREKINMQLITTENEAVDEIDINSSIQDSFINMINNDKELRAESLDRITRFDTTIHP